MTSMGDRDIEDSLVWPLNTSGSYSVRSGYNFLHAFNSSPSGSNAHTSHRTNERVWKTLWSTNIPPKIKHFLWRALNHILPTFLSLFRRKVFVTPMCPVCGSMEESVEHILLLCPFAQSVWFLSSLCYKVNPQAVTRFEDWYNGIFSLAGNNKEFRGDCLTKISYICWEIWKARCSFLYQYVKLDPPTISRCADSASFEFLSSMKNHLHCPIISPQSLLSRVHPPPQIQNNDLPSTSSSFVHPVASPYSLQSHPISISISVTINNSFRPNINPPQTQIHPSTSHTTSWSPPSRGWLKINFDAAFI